jgi:hypothetical protein
VDIRAARETARSRGCSEWPVGLQTYLGDRAPVVPAIIYRIPAGTVSVTYNLSEPPFLCP